MLLSFLSGYFKYIFILLFLVTVHELGHLLFASFLKFKVDKVIIYPFGGITKYNEPINTSIAKEFFVLIGGILFQELLFLLILFLYKKVYINEIDFNIIRMFNKTLLCFNLLPIIPLDGSKLLSLILEKFLPYKISNIILIVVSFVTIFITVIFEKRLIIILLSFILIKSIVYEIKIHNDKFNKFLLERYLYNFNFKAGNIINNIRKIKRDKHHKIIDKNKIYTEKEYLTNLFEKKLR